MADITKKLNDLADSIEGILDYAGIQNVHYAEIGQSMPRGSNFSDCDRIAVPLDGVHRMQTVCDGEVVTIKPVPGEVTFMPTGIWNYPDWELPVRVATLGFQDDYTWISYVNCNGKENASKAVYRMRIAPLSDDSAILKTAVKAFKSGNQSVGKCLLEALLYCCTGSMKKGVWSSSSTGKAAGTWRHINDYLEENYSCEICREDISQEFKLSPNYISCLCRSQTGMSFITYLNKIRIDKACFLLREYDQTLDEIAFNAGFSSTAYFCRVFKQLLKKTPFEYRNSR
ncbi:MAG: helix-turn-helix transcriptional regulator [Lentisphaerae bacterium]|nr:helix-turn-helix transcriptional regulator [Lentisphaerota bacterium]MCP4102243.1 helix-turn-helix transcriptional regulator [Lentisphaerota bacterium]